MKTPLGNDITFGLTPICYAIGWLTGIQSNTNNITDIFWGLGFYYSGMICYSIIYTYGKKTRERNTAGDL
jgi:hypothetical protein